MRALKVAIVVLALAPLIAIALGDGLFPAAVLAQLGSPPPPLPPPPPPPGALPTAALTAPAVLPPLGAPAVVGAPATAGAIPQLNTPLVLASPSPPPSARVFSCSCNGAASHTRWVGGVSAGNYFQARQMAVNQCLAFNLARAPTSPFIPPASFTFFPPPPPPLASSQAEPGLPNLQAPGLSGFALLQSPRAQAVLNFCKYCVCD